MTPFPRAQFKSLIAQILNMPAGYVIWRGEPEPSAGKPSSGQRWALLRITASKRTAVGWDDLRRTDNADGSFSTLATGRRAITLGCDLFSYAPVLEVLADDLLEELRSKPWHPDNLALLNAMGLVIEDAGDIIPLPTSVNGAELSAAHIDLNIALAVQDAAKYPGGNGYITEVQSTGAATGDQGVSNPSVDVTVPYP